MKLTHYYIIKIRNGRLALGTWQWIYLNEHRDQGGWGGGHTRNIVITLQGQSWNNLQRERKKIVLFGMHEITLNCI